jgi:hypothetical protein
MRRRIAEDGRRAADPGREGVDADSSSSCAAARCIADDGRAIGLPADEGGSWKSCRSAIIAENDSGQGGNRHGGNSRVPNAGHALLFPLQNPFTCGACLPSAKFCVFVHELFCLKNNGKLAAVHCL